LLKAITIAAGIRKAQKLLQDILNKALPKREGTYTIGYQGGNMDFTSLRANERIWNTHMAIEEESTPRHWNAFGLAKELKLNTSNPIVVEINIPLEGAQRRVAGLFAVDTSNNRLLLLHRGKVGGGKKGIGKKAFLTWYGKTPVKVHYDDSNETDEAILVADLSAPNMANQLADFVHAVAMFKDKAQQDEICALPIEKLKRKLSISDKKPKKVTIETTTFSRNLLVVEYVKRRASGVCQLCNNSAPFLDSASRPFLECHHIVWLSDGGKDSIDNAVALCPNCHAKMHILNIGSDVSKLMKKAGKSI
jgi:5-methylcytosine-specific restriction enzyme A